MRTAGFVCVSVVVIVLLARFASGGVASEVGVAEGTPAGPGARSPSSVPDVMSAPSAPPPATVPAATNTPQPSAAALQEAPPQEAPRRRRWRNYNRYPGPIPTPAEWRAPAGPVRIALQVGHWRTDEAPPELSGLRRNGTAWNGTAEWEVNLEIARRAGALLEEMGYLVDILPAVVPPGYRAHLFLAIHADASNDRSATGYRVAAPSRDATGRASGIVDLLNRTYGQATGIKRLPVATRRMRNYYAFNFRRYEHALHPMTIAAIIETGFLTNAGDRELIMKQPERVARGIVDAVVAFPITPPPGATPPAPILRAPWN